MHQTGFTLIEIILVIVIISLLGLGGWTLHQASQDTAVSRDSHREQSNTTEQEDAPREQAEGRTPTIERGIYGKISMHTGNCMPTTAGGDNSCEMSKVETTVFVREPVSREAMDEQYLAADSTLIKETRSDEDGWYEVELPPGTYSVFVADEGREYCNRSDGQGRMCPVTVGDEPTRHNINIDHATW